MCDVAVSCAALRSGGALTIYKQFIRHLQTRNKGIRYVLFVDPTMPKPDIPNVEYIEIDLSSFFKRVIFDFKRAKTILNSRGISPRLIISLQNTSLSCYKELPNIIYYHQSIPFYPNKWNPFKRGELLLFFYKHFYPFFVKASISATSDIIVQIPYMKQCFVKKFHVKPSSVHVFFPDINIVRLEKHHEDNITHSCVNLIYPAANHSYKNHIILLAALVEIKEYNPNFFNKLRLHFTIDSNRNELHRYCEKNDLIGHVCFDGQIPYDELMQSYPSFDALVFPSTIETLGLPMIEAASFGLPVIVSDMEYAHDVLHNYPGTIYCAPYDPHSWAEAIQSISPQKRYNPLVPSKDSSWMSFFDLVENRISKSC